DWELVLSFRCHLAVSLCWGNRGKGEWVKGIRGTGEFEPLVAFTFPFPIPLLPPGLIFRSALYSEGHLVQVLASHSCGCFRRPKTGRRNIRVRSNCLYSFLHRREHQLAARGKNTAYIRDLKGISL